MRQSEFLTTLERRTSSAGVVLHDELESRLWAYFDVLAAWNRKINLTGFSLDSPTDAAIDRLFVEPLVASHAVRRPVSAMIDIGSGGGSPAIPMALVLCPDRLVLVEARSRKGVFLKEVARVVGLSDRTEVLSGRFEVLAANEELREGFDLLTVRAVRVDSQDLLLMSGFLRKDGQLVLFGSGDGVSIPGNPVLRLLEAVPLGADGLSRAILVEKA